MNNLIKFIINSDNVNKMIEYKEKNKNWIEIRATFNMFLYKLEDRNSILNLSNANFPVEYLYKRYDKALNFNYYYIDTTQLKNIIKSYAKNFPNVKFIYFSYGANLEL